MVKHLKRGVCSIQPSYSDPHLVLSVITSGSLTPSGQRAFFDRLFSMSCEFSIVKDIFFSLYIFYYLFKFKSIQTYTSSLSVWINRSILLSCSYRSLINYISHILVLYYLCHEPPHSHNIVTDMKIKWINTIFTPRYKTFTLKIFTICYNPTLFTIVFGIFALR